jgi:hypothetical protein
MDDCQIDKGPDFSGPLLELLDLLPADFDQWS